eukprot:12263615-Prorocentrum_lima.AAC.1
MHWRTFPGRSQGIWGSSRLKVEAMEAVWQAEQAIKNRPHQHNRLQVSLQWVAVHPSPPPGGWWKR